MPFVTEEIWQGIPGRSGASIMEKRFPGNLPVDDDAERLMGYMTEAVTSIRSIRGELNVPPATELEAVIRLRGEDAEKCLRDNQDVIMRLARLKSLDIGREIKRPPGSTSIVGSAMEIFVPVKGVLDIGAEIERLKKEMEKIDETLSYLDRKLLNEDFLASAPAAIVEKEKRRYAESIEKRQKISDQMDRLIALQ